MESICRINVSNNGYYEVICLDKVKISLLNELLAKIAFEMIRITKTDGNKNHICLSKERFDLANKLAKDETELSDFFRNLSYSPFSIEIYEQRELKTSVSLETLGKEELLIVYILLCRKFLTPHQRIEFIHYFMISIDRLIKNLGC
ncbi:hypothetical protein [Eggerthia catenaformis]|uniref:hypothetical protein n=1 Tax=Eggerthia catenaformis TaxID=31973 RepID=UPI0028EC07FE|nr:hypothetical protein [Eggerthia catenaformis]